MKLLRAIFLLSLSISLSAPKAQQPGTKVIAQSSDFLIDPSKPYAYLELDHVGPRKPLRDGEPNVGIWLRLKNNCRLPIVIVAVETSTDTSREAITVQDEVVPNSHSFGEDRRGSNLYIPRDLPELQELTDIFHSPNMNEAEVRGVEEAQRRAPEDHAKEALARPHGYNNGYEPGAQKLTLIKPGGQVSFSVPANHVSKDWHLEIPFRLALPNKGGNRPPYSYLAFYQGDLRDSQGSTTPPTTR
jgi:hypothetical protein